MVLVLLTAVLTVCSTKGFLELFHSRSVTTAKILSLTYGKPEVSCNSLMVAYFGKQSASLMKEFCNFCNLMMTLSEAVMMKITPYSIIGLIHCL